MPLSFVAIDFETANPKRGSVCQIGIAMIRDGQVVAEAEEYVTPAFSLGTFAQRNIDIHGIYPQDVAGAPGWPEILERIIRFSGDLPLVAHNASVERSCIVQASEAHGITAPVFPYYCTLNLAKKVVPGRPSYSLRKLTADLGLPDFSHHEAKADALASATMLMHLAGLRGATSFAELPEGVLRHRA